MAGDATLDFLARLNDPARWVVVRDVPIFRPHTRRNQDGSVKYTVTEHDIQSIAATATAKERQNGVAGIITLGHRLTDPRAPEPQQPRVVGYLRNMRPGTFGPEQVPCDLVDAYYKREDWDEARLYPFRSAEYYPAKREITGVALLVRDPELELGVVSYATEANHYCRDDGPVYFPELYMSQPSDRINPEKAKQILKDDSAQGHPLTEKQKGMFGAAAGKLEKNMADDPTKPPMGHAPGAGEHPEGVPPEHHEMFMRCMRHHGYPEHYSEVKEELGGPHEEPTHEPVHAAAGAFPGPTNAGVPAAPHHPEHSQRQNSGDIAAMLRANREEIDRANNARFEAYERKIKEAEAKVWAEECERYYSQLTLQNGYVVDHDDFMARASQIQGNKPALTRMIDVYMRNNRQDPAVLSRRRIPNLDVDGLGLQPLGEVDPDRQRADETDDLDRRLEMATNYQRTNQDKSWGEAMAWAKEQTTKR